MTRHYLTPKDHATADTIWVGYDRPTRSFMSQVYKDTDFPEMVSTTGLPYEVVSHAEDIIAEASHYAFIPAGLLAALETDQDLAPTMSTTEANAITYWSPTDRHDSAPGDDR